MSVTCEIESRSSPPELYSAIPVEVAEYTMPSDQGMVLNSVSEFNLAEMTDMEYTHLQHIIYSQMEAQSEEKVPGDAASSPPAIHTLYTSADPQIDFKYTAKTPSPTVGQSNTPSPELQCLSTSSDEQNDFQEIKVILMGDPDHTPDRTSTTYGEPVLARANAMENSEHTMGSTYGRGAAVEMRPNPPARVRLESRFTCSPRQQESRHDQPTAQNSVLSKLHHPAEIFAAAIQPQSCRCLKLGRAKSTVSPPVEFPYPALYGSNMCNSMVGLSQSQGIGYISHILEAAKDPDLIIPRNFSFNFSYQQDAGPAKSALCNENEQAVEPQISSKTEEELRKYMPPARYEQGRFRQVCPKRPALNNIQNAVMDNSRETFQMPWEGGDKLQRRERHNILERDRRRRIRICCDELNMLVPFCNRHTDKASTLHWTTAFIKYINEIYGDSLKMEFQNTFCGMTGKRINLTEVDDQFSSQRETEPTMHCTC
ncbi:hypothetical protein AAFF_G00342890 [Aldrovandia affinis]|uniref:BHLH domain-containing protein n=1 Tax=Aldrovandia affinis TaxID=143900 RepID=A0AAD7SJS4_9TELE|nr:hypothetical protein AAFF_G00342890 [Aldrovandia affinis]